MDPILSVIVEIFETGWGIRHDKDIITLYRILQYKQDKKE